MIIVAAGYAPAALAPSTTIDNLSAVPAPPFRLSKTFKVVFPTVAVVVFIYPVTVSLLWVPLNVSKLVVSVLVK